MRQHIQLRIATPCQEQWASLRPEEQGRYCGSCKKTVVDFTAMDDREILAYMAKAGQGVCGRLAPDQLNRDLSFQPVTEKSRWKGWQLILAGMLIAIRLPAQSRMARTRPIAAIAPIREHIAPVVQQDSLPKVAVDSFKVLPEVVVYGYTNRISSGYMGGLSFVRAVTISRWQQRVADTLAACHLLPKKELSVYPNPARRGTATSLSWQTEPGEYQVGMFNIAGALVHQRMVQVVTGGQVDLLEIPGALPTGIYIIRAVRADSGKVYSRKLEVL